MDAADRQYWHFLKFKMSRRRMASAAQIGKPHKTQTNGHETRDPITLGHMPDYLPAKQHWRDAFRSWWYRLKGEWEPVVVNKQIDSVTMPKWIAIGIFGAVLTFGIQSWYRSAADRDVLIEMKTELRLLKESKTLEDAERKAQSAEEKAWREIMHGNQKKIEGMLTQQQLDALERLKRGTREN